MGSDCSQAVDFLSFFRLLGMGGLSYWIFWKRGDYVLRADFPIQYCVCIKKNEKKMFGIISMGGVSE